MKQALIPLLRCPKSGQRLHLIEADRDDDIQSGSLVSEDGHNRYSIAGGVPRFVPASNYADNFGMQWNKFSKTQLDSYSGHPISANRFWAATTWKREELHRKWVLDVGCGAGRFAEVALEAGAIVVALDYSSAVDACYSNLRRHPNLHVVQGNIYTLPFAPASFSFVYSLGVLQHTPDVAKAFFSLPKMDRQRPPMCRFLRKIFQKRAVAQVLAKTHYEKTSQARFVFSVTRLSADTAPVQCGAWLHPCVGPTLETNRSSGELCRILTIAVRAASGVVSARHF